MRSRCGDFSDKSCGPAGGSLSSSHFPLQSSQGLILTPCLANHPIIPCGWVQVLFNGYSTVLIQWAVEPPTAPVVLPFVVELVHDEDFSVQHIFPVELQNNYTLFWNLSEVPFPPETNYRIRVGDGVTSGVSAPFSIYGLSVLSLSS